MANDNLKLHRQLLHISLSLYFVALWTSMAGMEIFGWLTFLLSITYAFRHDGARDLLELIKKDLPWKALVGLYLVTIIGLFVNGSPEADKVFIIGSQRWMFLLISGSYALTIVPPTPKGYRLFLVVSSIIALYAIFQSFTGIDLLRMNGADPNRAVQRLDMRTEISLWRSAGLFGSPMGYVYIAGMYACLPLAVGMLVPHKSIRRASLIAFIIIAASLVTTYVRGAWIAMAFAWLAMAWLASRRVFYAVAGAGAVAFAALFVGLIQFRERLMSLFDMRYTSNNDRWNLWKMNWRIFQDYPILGIGWEENETRACEYVNCNPGPGLPKPFTGHAHNNYLQALSGMGITGFICYMIFIGFFLWATVRLWKRLPKDLYWARAITLACFGAQIHLHIGGFTECNFKAGATSHNFMIVLGLVAAMSYLERKGLLRDRYASTSLERWPQSWPQS